MSDSFRRAYAKLTDFVVGHPEIEIGDSVTSIPENVRPGFYSLFNEARSAFVGEEFAEHLKKAKALQREFDKITEESTEWFSLEDISVTSKLRRFVQDPGESITRELFDLLFELLKKRETLDSFETKASIAINAFFPSVYSGGYEKWVVLALANLLGVQRAFRVPVRELQPGDRAKSAAYAPMEEVPLPVDSVSFFFSQPAKAIFAVPDFIIRSSKLDRFVGVRSEFREGIYRALNLNHERDWLPLDRELLVLLERGLTLIYLAEKLESLSLVADVSRICRPDMVLFCVDSQSTPLQEALDCMAVVENRLSPAKGCFVISNGPWRQPDASAPLPPSEMKPDQVSPKIHFLSPGFDRSNLLPVMDALREAEDSVRAT